MQSKMRGRCHWGLFCGSFQMGLNFLEISGILCGRALLVKREKRVKEVLLPTPENLGSFTAHDDDEGGVDGIQDIERPRGGIPE